MAKNLVVTEFFCYFAVRIVLTLKFDCYGNKTRTKKNCEVNRHA